MHWHFDLVPAAVRASCRGLRAHWYNGGGGPLAAVRARGVRAHRIRSLGAGHSRAVPWDDGMDDLNSKLAATRVGAAAGACAADTAVEATVRDLPCNV